MTQPQHPSTVLVLSPKGDDGLAAILRSSFGDCRVQCHAFNLTDWLREGAQQGLRGVVVDTDSIALADLRVIAASLASRPTVWLLLLVGDRGLAGFEELLERDMTEVLPQPWTPQGLAHSLRAMGTDSSPSSSFPRAFLDGLVEGLRDPLTSISGYLQLLDNQEGDNVNSLVSPALDAAAQLSSQLEFVHLASAELHPHPDSYPLEHIADELQKFAKTAGVDVILDTNADLRIEADLRYLRAAMQSAFLLLQRFGSGGQLSLVARESEQGKELLWQQEPPAIQPQHPIAPPAYLEDLFKRLCLKISAESVVKHVHGDIPNIVGVRW